MTIETSKDATKEMPKYRCHKEVWALRIAAIEIHNDGSATVTPADEGYAPFATNNEWAARFHGSHEDTGYYVQYKDGHTSWSPTDAFVEGYSLIKK